MKQTIAYTAFLLVCVLTSCRTGAQVYEDGILAYRRQYIADLLAEPRKPLSPSQVKGLNFYPPNTHYVVTGEVTVTPGTVPFLMQTHSGKQKPFRQYGTVSFILDGNRYTLHLYQSMDLVKEDAHKDELFVPFTDATNYEETFGGGRYMDFSIIDIHDGKLLIDFNKCYNPYCAYADGFSCPIPPGENRLMVEIRAGEKNFLH